MKWCAYFSTVCWHVDAVTALPSLARGMMDDITRCIGLTIGKGPPFVYLPSWVPTTSGSVFGLSHALIQRSWNVVVGMNWDMSSSNQPDTLLLRLTLVLLSVRYVLIFHQDSTVSIHFHLTLSPSVCPQVIHGWHTQHMGTQGPSLICPDDFFDLRVFQQTRTVHQMTAIIFGHHLRRW